MERKCQTALRKYCREVGKQLVCKRSTKDRLLAALRDELRDTVQDCVSMEELSVQIGTPTEMAKNLQETVSDQEYAQVVKLARRNRRIVIPAIVIASLLLITAALTYAYHIRNLKPTRYIDTTIAGETVPGDVIWGEGNS